MFKLSPQKTGTLYGCGAFTNIGSTGALVCFVFLCEKGFALVLIYKLFEELSYYAIGFPIAKYYSSSSREERIRDHLKNLIVSILSCQLPLPSTINNHHPPYLNLPLNKIFIKFRINICQK
jgi:predicted permease